MHLLSNFNCILLLYGLRWVRAGIFLSGFYATLCLHKMISRYRAALTLLYKEALTQASLKQEGRITLRKPSVNFAMHLYSSL